jgi:hypothetical protein
VKNRVAVILRTAATSLLESDSYLGLVIVIYVGSYPRLRLPSKQWHDILQC